VQPRIAIELFGFLDEAISELQRDTLYKPISPTSAVREFARNFYAQFFENVLNVEVQDISMRSALRANVLLRKNNEWSEERRALVRRFQKLCKLSPDLAGGDYGGGASLFRKFHDTFVPALLKDIEAWARFDNEEALAQQAASTRQRYLETIEEIDRDPPH
jgi:hypothetical protein